jgi:hypothetical protein
MAASAVVVVAGYDRPLRQLFLQVLRDGEAGRPCEDDVVYDSLHEPALDWSVIGTLTDKLAMLGIAVPESLIEAVYWISASTQATAWFDTMPTGRRKC